MPTLSPLAILIEAKNPQESKSIKFNSIDLNHPFVKIPQSRSSVFEHRGSRKFKKLIIQSIECDRMESKDNVKFSFGNPTVETIEGIVHFYKYDKKFNTEDKFLTKMLCMLGIPSHMHIKDLINFIEPLRQIVKEIKIVREESPQSYFAFFKFETPDKACEFFNAFNESKFNDIESDVCQIACISHIDTKSPNEGPIFPINELTELPSCPVCLEHLDEPLQGVITTILCNHSFHDRCLIQMSELNCPVCRYISTPQDVGENVCSDCDLRENLWICLICGNVGCGRYGKKHAHKHFDNTGHMFALEIGKNLVWDYVDDAYVHRIAVNQSDGKLIQVGDSTDPSEKKMELINTEFSDILMTQLESQRRYFEHQIDSLKSNLELSLERSMANETSLKESNDKLTERLKVIEKDNETCKRKLEQLTSLSRRLKKELEDEKALNESLQKSQEVWQSRAEKAEVSYEQCSQDLKELMLNLEFRDKLVSIQKEEEIDDDQLASSQVTISEPKTKARSKRKKK